MPKCIYKIIAVKNAIYQAVTDYDSMASRCKIWSCVTKYVTGIGPGVTE